MNWILSHPVDAFIYTLWIAALVSVLALILSTIYGATQQRTTPLKRLIWFLYGASTVLVSTSLYLLIKGLR